MRSTAEVLADVKCFADRGREGRRLSPARPFFAAEEALRGPDAIRAVFEGLFSGFAKPGASIRPKQRLVEGVRSPKLLSIHGSGKYRIKAQIVTRKQSGLAPDVMRTLRAQPDTRHECGHTAQPGENAATPEWIYTRPRILAECSAEVGAKSKGLWIAL